MPQALDMALLDAHLEELLDLPEALRSVRLERLSQTEPDLALLLRKLLTIAAKVETADIRPQAAGLRLIDEEAPAPEIAGYRLGEEIGRGGMATVYAAVRDVHGTEQAVAVKVLRAALLSAIDRERFLNEQRILARLQHPNIATLLDVGVVDGRPYMAMERIEGEPIDARLKPTIVDLPAILDAIVQVTDAVQLAHEHFVIHRDIKPDNVLVDRQGRIKLIDFGIAKILEEASGLRADPTLTGTTPLTLRYASPEQLLDRPIGIGSDIYQLGLLLYRLATGAWPHEDADGLPQIERLREDALSVPASRRVSEPRLRRALQGDIDSILLKCLHFDPALRYRSAVELKADLLRYRQRRPVSARRQTRGYLVKRFVLRHRLGVGLAAGAFVLVVVIAMSAVVLASRSRQFAERTTLTLDAVTEMLSPANPYAPSPKTTTVAEAVDRATDRFLNEDLGDSDFQARILARLSSMQEAAENYSRMRELLERADTLIHTAGSDASLRSHVLERELKALFYLGAYDEFTRLRDDRASELLGDDRLRADHLLASVLSEQGRFPEALLKLQSLLPTIGSMAPSDRANVFNTLGNVYGGLKQYNDELASYRRAEALLDPNDLAQLPTWIRVRANIATALGNLKRPREAAELYATLLERVKQKLGVSHPMAAKIAANTMVMLMGVERYDDAFAVSRDFDSSSVLTSDPSWRAQYLAILAGTALFDGQFREALPNLVDGVRLATDTLGKGSPRLAYFAEQLAWALWEYDERQLALQSAAVAYRLSEGKRSTADLLLQLGGDLGLGVPGRPDPDFTARLESDCDRLHYTALRSRFVDGKLLAPGTRVPLDCYSIERSRLEVLGLVVDPPRARDDGAQPLRSPLTLRWSNPTDPALAATVIGDAERHRLESLIASLE